ncbi:MAG: multicopper oxidase domain-containing protein [Gemmatimonadetes bacterium]|nr:multicopper oxidase domain-containing protein [Gemmatimonadota bacterium]
MSDQHPDGSPADGTGRTARRDFVQLGAAGLIASVSAPSPASAAARDARHRTADDRSGTRQQQSGPPPLDRIVDPTRVEAETWLEPWVFRPDEWPDDALHLNLVAGENPGPSPSPGNRFSSLFSWGGISPAPTIRMRGDQSLRIKVRNLLGQSHFHVPIGMYPDPLDLPPDVIADICRLVAARQGIRVPAGEEPPECDPFVQPEEVMEIAGVRTRPAHLGGEPVNGQHGARVTNLHTHGLHTEPNRNTNGSLGDDVMLRIISRADWRARQREQDAGHRRLHAHERLSEADFEHHLGDVMRVRSRRDGLPPQPHPPGTHWYHPHAHGSTHDQVSSGVAGFLIVEGDVDDAINRVMTGSTAPDPSVRTGPWDYRERLVFIQRVEVPSVDLDAGPGSRRRDVPFPVAVNGVAPPTVMFTRPGAVERWRVLNASVDGRGFKRFMVLDGQYVHANEQLWRVVPPETESGERRLVPVSRQEVEEAKLPLHLLALDGITLVSVENGSARHTIRDLSTRNAGTVHPVARPPAAGQDPFRAMLRNIEDCFRDGDGIRHCFNRPNEVYMWNALRADVFFKTPRDGAGRVYTIFAQEVLEHTDNFQQRLQIGIDAQGRRRPDAPPPPSPFNPAPLDVVLAYVHVRGDPVDGGEFDVASLRDHLPPVPPFLQPISDDELRIPAAEAARRDGPAGSFRTRVLSYSGWGSAEFPLIEVPEAFARAHPELKNLGWAEWQGARMVVPPGARTMAIQGRFDLAVNPDPGPPRKFSHDDPDHPRVLVETAEEWVLYNNSMMLWSNTDIARHPQPGQFGQHYRAFPLSRAEGQARNARDPQFQITAKGSDHPFHIHINPAWVTRIEVPDQNGRLHNILDEPVWLDTVGIPRNGGRVVFRTRFADFTGTWIHHCHILMHEDMGMMQTVDCGDDPSLANYNPKPRVASHGATADEVSAIYPPPSLALMYRQNLAFIDPNPTTGQVFPGFDFEVPVLGDD